MRRRSLVGMALLGTLALVLTACPADPEPDPVAVPDPVDDEIEPDEPLPVTFPYETGIFEDMESNSYWAYFDPASTVWTGYVLGSTKCSLYSISAPANVVVPDLATEDFQPAVEEADGWVVEVPIYEDAVWSDGEPLTAHDFVFTFETVRDLELGGNWYGYWHPDRIISVEAPDDHTVRIVFEEQPGLAVWPNDVGVSGIVMPEHVWGDTVAAATAADDLFAADGADDVSCGPTIFEQWEPGAFVAVVPNDSWHGIGGEFTVYEDGSVHFRNPNTGVDGIFGEGAGEGDIVTQYTVGPYMEDQTFTLYGTQDAAVLALRDGEVDYLYNPLGLERGLQDPVLEDPELSVVTNPAYGIRYMAFNFEREPMDDPAFRRALATMIDRDFMAEGVLGGVAFPLYTAMPPGNLAWYDPEVGDALAAQYRDLANEFERLDAAVEILRDAGWTWEVEPGYTTDDDGNPQDIVPGEGIIMPNGEPMPSVSVLTPGAGYDPLRATYGVWIERWAQELGMPLRAQLTGFDTIVQRVFVADPTDFDIYILGWSLGNPAMPTFYESFFKTDAGNNPLGYSNPEYDEAVDRFMAATELEEAYSIVWNELEPMLDQDLPYVNLFDTPILEFYRSGAIEYPFEDTIGGLQFWDGFPSLVQQAR